VPDDSVGRLDLLLTAALELTAEHDLDHILEQTVQRAAEVARARFAALGVYGAEGRIERFVHVGIDAEMVARIGHHPQGRGLLGDVIVADGPIRLADLRADPRSVGFPAHHPDMRSFLGVPVRLANRRFGNLYLTEKQGWREFDAEDERLVVTLAAFAAAAIEAALLLDTERRLRTAHERAHAQSEMLGRVIDAQEAERARVARDLHDQIGQSLTSVLLGLRLVDGTLARGAPDLDDARAHTAEVRALVAQALDEVRRLAFDLRPTVLDDVGLVAALRRLARGYTERSGMPVEVGLVGLDDDTRLPPEIETVVYRVVQEALTNVARHAAASRSDVELAVSGHRVRATVADDGVGFTVDDDVLGSLGLAGMRERASLAGGRLDVVSGPGEGTTVLLEVPR
jgi:signal transduction histidine kinase